MSVSIVSDLASNLSGESVASRQRHEQLIAQLDFHRQQLGPYSLEAPEAGFVDAVKEFLTFMAGYEDLATYEAFESSANFVDYQRFFSPRVLRFTWDMEELTFTQIKSRQLKPQQKLGEMMAPHIWGAYNRMEDTLKLVDFSACKNYLMLGCGMVPASLFYLHDWTDVPNLVGIDNDPLSLNMAGQLVEKFGLSRISILGADATEFDYSDFDVIYWGPFASPRKKVMEAIARTARQESVIVLRDPYFTGSLAFERLLPCLADRFEVCAQGDESFSGRFMLKHYILKLK